MFFLNIIRFIIHIGIEKRSVSSSIHDPDVHEQYTFFTILVHV